MASKRSRKCVRARTDDIEKERSGGGYECEFVKPPASDVQSECPICLLVLRDPQSVTCCGKSFCAVCITRLRKAGKRCPTCNAGKFTCTPDAMLENAFRKLRVRCGNQRMGCEWSGTLCDLDSHLNLDSSENGYKTAGCEFASVECDFCTELYKRRFIAEHEAQHCPQRSYSCTECHQKGTYESITKVHWFECQRKLLEEKLKSVRNGRHQQQSGWCSVWLLTLVISLCAIMLAAVLNNQNDSDDKLMILSQKIKELEDNISTYEHIIDSVQSHSVPIQENLARELKRLQREVNDREERINSEHEKAKNAVFLSLNETVDHLMNLLEAQQKEMLDKEASMRTLVSELKHELQQTKDALQQNIDSTNTKLQQCLSTVAALETKLTQSLTDCDNKVNKERKEREASYAVLAADIQEIKNHRKHHHHHHHANVASVEGGEFQCSTYD